MRVKTRSCNPGKIEAPTIRITLLTEIFWLMFIFSLFGLALPEYDSTEYFVLQKRQMLPL